MPRSKLFISYSHMDQEWRDRLMSHLAVLEQAGLVDVWADTRIAIGSKWRDVLDHELGACQVAVLLISANYLGSPFIRKVEMKTLFEKHERQGLLLLPVIARPCAWQLVEWLAERQSRPDGGRALSWGRDPEIDRDLAMLTYEIGMLLRKAGPGALGDMYRLSAELATRSPAYQARTPRAGPIPLAGRAWRGHYSGVNDDLGRQMDLEIESDDGVDFRGRIDWGEAGETTVEGSVRATPSPLEDGRAWALSIRQAERPLCGLRFTDIDQRRGRRLELHGDYRAILEDDMRLVGFWYPSETGRDAIGRFVLHPDPRRS